MLQRLLLLANKLDAAGLTKEADLLDKIAQMDEWDDEGDDWGGFDSLEGAEGELGAEEGGEMGSVESLVTQLEAMKGMVEEGMIDEAQLAEVQQQVEALQALFLGGGPSMVTGEEPQSADAWGGSMELGGKGLEAGEIPVAEASRRRRNILRKLV